MSFDAIRESKILAKISGFTVFLQCERNERKCGSLLYVENGNLTVI